MSVCLLAGDQSFGEERSLITSALAPHRDCASVELARDNGQEAYAAYAGCVLNNSFPAFFALYTRHLREFPDEKQDVEVRFTVGSDGRAETVVASAPGVTDLGFLRKLEARLKLINFIPPAGTDYAVVYTFAFSRAQS